MLKIASAIQNLHQQVSPSVACDFQSQGQKKKGSVSLQLEVTGYFGVLKLASAIQNLRQQVSPSVACDFQSQDWDKENIPAAGSCRLLRTHCSMASALHIWRGHNLRVACDFQSQGQDDRCAEAWLQHSISGEVIICV